LGSASFIAGVMAFTFAGSAVAASDCKRPAPTVLVERFTPADCESCWQTATAQDPKDPRRERVLLLDWIVPAADDAPLAAAAMPEATARAGTSTARTTKVRRVTLTQARAPQLRIADGPAWNGYIGIQLSVRKRGPLPADAVAYAALVERVPAGSEGTPVARQLVRALVGPLSLDELASQPSVLHLRALRLPEASRADRLASVGWVETTSGRVIAATQSTLGDCAADKR
jgi:hypothetical protein